MSAKGAEYAPWTGSRVSSQDWSEIRDRNTGIDVVDTDRHEDGSDGGDDDTEMGGCNV